MKIKEVLNTCNISFNKMQNKRKENNIERQEEKRQEEDVKIIHVLSYGGGLNSTALLIFLIKNNYPLDLVLFSDTGDEFPHTYETVNYYKKYCKDKGIRFKIVRSELADSLYTYMWNKKIVPSRIRRDCTSKFKISPMRKFLRNEYGKDQKFLQYIGIDYEEAHRMRDSDVKYIENKYPLVDNKINRIDCEKLLASEEIPIPKKSGCYYCPFTTRPKWIKLLDENPDLYEKAILLERNTTKYPQSNSLLHSIPLLKLKDRKAGNTKLDKFVPDPTCDVSGSCFL
jgi:phosphoadenosine phosphosulfate reductase family protein